MDMAYRRQDFFALLDAAAAIDEPLDRSQQRG
jgi:hypothetical protein